MDVDVVVLGTGLRESVLAAALSKAGCTVAHLDHNAYYGGDDASLSLDELRQWADERTVSTHTSTYLTSQHARFTSISSSSPSPPPKSRQFSISLSPTIIPSVGPLVDALVASGASRYGGFKLLERVALYDKPGFVKTVPGSKEDVFKSADLSLLEKRRLMRFLMFSASEFEAKPELEGKEDAPFLEFLRQTFSLNESTSEAVAYALAFCACAADPTLPALQRIRTYLRSAGRYGASPFLIGHYGGVGEVAQGFCRISAVQGGIYILGREVSSIDRPDAAASGESSSRQFSVSLKNFEEQLHCDLLVSTDDYLDTGLLSRATRIAEAEAETQSTARCMAIIDHRIAFRNERDSATAANPADAENPQEEDRSDQVDTALLIFPPSSVEGGSTTMAANVLVSGEQSLAAPRNHWVLHISMPVATDNTRSAEDLLTPYLTAALSLASPGPEGVDTPSQPIQPVHALFYIQHPPSPPAQSSTALSQDLFIPPSNTTTLAGLVDSAVSNAETTFWRVVERLREIKRNRSGEQVEEGTRIESFWPPISDTSVVDQDW